MRKIPLITPVDRPEVPGYVPRAGIKSMVLGTGRHVVPLFPYMLELEPKEDERRDAWKQPAKYKPHP